MVLPTYFLCTEHIFRHRRLVIGATQIAALGILMFRIRELRLIIADGLEIANVVVRVHFGHVL